VFNDPSPTVAFDKIIQYYTFEQINELCRSMCGSSDNCYTVLEKKSPLRPFVIREAFNDPAWCLYDYLSRLFLVNKVLEKNFLPEIAGQVKQFYNKSNAHLVMQAQLWRPVCRDACKHFEINDSDKNRCLKNTFLWPQPIKTMVNSKLALEGK